MPGIVTEGRSEKSRVSCSRIARSSPFFRNPWASLSSGWVLGAVAGLVPWPPWGMAFGGSGGVPFCLVCGIVLGVRIENEELSTPVQVRGIGCLAGYADSWAGRVVFERLTRHGVSCRFSAWMTQHFGTVWHTSAQMGLFRPVWQRLETKKKSRRSMLLQRL